jgi:hypothetical protein
MVKRKQKSINIFKRSKMRKIEKITLIMSMVAILISIISLYYQFFHISHNFKVSVVSIAYDNNHFIADVVLMNGGNKHECIINAGFIFSYSKDFTPEAYCPKTNFEPLIIKPGEKIFQKYTSDDIELDLLNEWTSKSEIEDAVYGGLIFEVINKNNKHESIQIENMYISIKNSKVLSVGYDPLMINS